MATPLTATSLLPRPPARNIISTADEQLARKEISTAANEHKFYLSLNLGYPLAKQNLPISGLASGALTGNYRFYSGKNLSAGWNCLLSFDTSREKSGHFNSFTYSNTGIFGGFDIGYNLPFARALSLHLYPQAGYAYSMLRQETTGKTDWSADPTLRGTLEIRYDFSQVAINIASTYKTIFYNGTDYSGMDFSVGVGYYF